MSLLYSFKMRLIQKRSNYKVYFLAIFSISIALYFVLMFLTKIYINNQQMRFYSQQISNNLIIYNINNDELLSYNIDYTLHSVTSDYLQFNKQKYKIDLFVIDNNYSQFYKIKDINHQKWKQFIQCSNCIFVSKEVARQFNLAQNSNVIIASKEFRVLDIVDNPFFAKRVIISINNYPNTISKFKLVTSAKNEHLFNNVKYESLNSVYFQIISSLKHFSMFLIVFFSIFLLISLINIYLIYNILLNSDRKSRVVKYICGENIKTYTFSLCLDNLITSLIAFHFCLLIYYLLLPIMPEFFYFDLIFNVYLMELLLVVVISCLLSLFLAKREIKTNLIIQLRT